MRRQFLSCSMLTNVLAAPSSARLFLGVERSATGRAWRDRLDERGARRALAIFQRCGTPELLARILAGRDVEPDAVEAYLDPAIRRLMPDPHVLTAMEAATARRSPPRRLPRPSLACRLTKTPRKARSAAAPSRNSGMAKRDSRATSAA